MPKKSDLPSEKVDKKGKSKPNLVEEVITYPISVKKKIDTVNKTEKSQTSKKQSLPPKKAKTDTLNSIDKSRSTQRTNLSNKITRIEKPIEIDSLWDNKYFYDFSEQGDDLAGTTPDTLRIPSKNKRKKLRHFDH